MRIYSYQNKLMPSSRRIPATVAGMGVLILIAISLGACGGGRFSAEQREHTAQEIARSGGFARLEVTSAPLPLMAYANIENAETEEAVLYLEGDGYAWATWNRPSMNPTPITPKALELAALDNSENVIYLARPCQYKAGWVPGKCDKALWTNRRFGPEVVRSTRSALRDISRQTGISTFHLVGYSGGGGLALLIAADLEESETDNNLSIASVRTVAGNLAPHFHARYHGVSPLTGSRSPLEHISTLSTLPQIHYVGEDDQIVPPAIARHYLSYLRSDACARLRVLAGVTHQDGWRHLWEKLHSRP